MINEKINILLIEDNPSDARLFDFSLKESFSNQYSLTTANNLTSGLDHLSKTKFDIVILDLSLPDSFGLDSFKQVHDESFEAPIIVLTGLEDESTGINAVKLGAQDFLIKGKIKSKTLKRSINYSIERFKLLKELSSNAMKLEERTKDLLREKQKLSEAQKLAHVGSWEWDLNGNSIAISEELCNVYGFPEGTVTVLERDFFGCIDPADVQHVKSAIDTACASLHPFNIHHRIIRPDKEVRMLHARGEILSDIHRKAVRILGTGQDVTERFREEELEKLVLAATKSYNSVVISNREGKIEWVNDGFTKLSGYSLDLVKNTYGELLKNGNEADVVKQKNYYARVLKEKMPVSFENLNCTKDGKGYWTITTLTPVLGKEKEVERIIAIDSDITFRKQMEEELLQANKIAEHSLMKGNKALTELMIAKKQLEESMKVKEQFLANMSHEIRTPMNAIVGFTNLLNRTVLSADQSQYVDAIRTSGENLLVIINDILDFTKIQSGKINFERIEMQLSESISAVTEMMLHKSMEKHIKLSSVIDKRIHNYLIGDPTRLNQILLNLVGNAIKFTEKGEVKISVEQINETGELVELKFSVADTGIGIPEHKLGSVFEGFTQATNDTTRKYGGTGLGLTIVKQLVELQGGSIAVESKLGEGSVFSFQLQFKKGHGRSGLDRKSRQEEEENEMPKLKGLNLLLVEDNFLNQVLAKKVLNDWNWEVDVAENGLVAIEKHTAKNFDLILMDIQLPEMDGYEATKHIRRKMAPDKSGIPIIAMTAHAISGEADKCFKAGMNDYISKPFDPKDLYSKIANIINRKKGLQTQPHTSLQSSNVTKTMSNPKCIDLTYLKELSNGSQDFIQQMIKLFLEQTPQGIETMEAAYGSKDWKMLKAAAHKMKPSFGFMGISGLKDIVAELEEDAAKGANEAGMGEKIAKIKSVCSQAFAELEAERT